MKVKRNPITQEQIEISFQYAKLVYEKEMDENAAVRQAVEESGINENSMKNYISIFSCMKRGVRASVGMSQRSIENYLSQFQELYGDEAVRKGKKACRFTLTIIIRIQNLTENCSVNLKSKM